jgi:DNA polymerase III, alpha subunit
MDTTCEFSKNCFNQIEGFGEYGFPESHAASFAFLVYASAWIKFHYPAIFTCAILNSQPMGFYAPSQIIRDAKEHGVSIHQPCINNSVWDNRVIKNKITGKLDLQLGFRQIKQFSKKYADIIISKRKYKYESINDLLELKTVPLSVLNLLAKADCFAVLNLSRRDASWNLKFLKNNDLPLFQKNTEIYGNNDAKLPEMTLGEELIEDYKSLKLSLKAHPVSLIRHIITPEAA